MKKSSITQMVQLALFSALIVVLAIVPGIGYIPLGVIRATTIHIPVIIGSILLGPKKGAFLGGVFGMTSLLMNTFLPTISSFVFSPFYSGAFGGNFSSLIICFVPRILTGIVPYYVYRLISKNKKRNLLGLSVAGFAGSMTNTLLVMNMIYLFFGQHYAQVKNITENLYQVILGVIFVNGTLEAIVATALTTAVCQILIKRVQLI